MDSQPTAPGKVSIADSKQYPGALTIFGFRLDGWGRTTPKTRLSHFEVTPDFFWPNLFSIDI